MPKVKNILEDAADAALPSTDEEEEPFDDHDTCNSFEQEKLFQIKYRISDESAVTIQKEYVLNLCHDGAFTRLAAGLSNGEVHIFDINAGTNLNRACIESIAPPIDDTKKRPINICGVQFLDDTSNNCLLIGTSNGLVRLYDLRSQRVEANFENDKNIICFERNANGRVLCAGTEQYEKAVNLIFHDVRERKQLGAYFDSHQDDITSVRFHPRNPDELCSGSTDGLINIFDIKETNEDDALLTTINTESSVFKLNWHKNVYERDLISCITYTNDFNVYDPDRVWDTIAEFDRDKITSSMKRSNPANCNLVNAHNMEDHSVFLLAGTNIKRGEILRTLRLQGKNLMPLADFDGNKQIVRESLYNGKNRVLITAGESGIITLWTPESFGQENLLTSSSKTLKSKTKVNSNKKSPY